MNTVLFLPPKTLPLFCELASFGVVSSTRAGVSVGKGTREITAFFVGVGVGAFVGVATGDDPA